MKQISWDVFLVNIETDDGYIYQKCIDRVFFNRDCDAQYVYRSLVDHDGYSPDIIVRNNYLHLIALNSGEEALTEHELENMYVYPKSSCLDF